jgi:DNA repair protein RecN (Recombination protein N)
VQFLFSANPGQPLAPLAEVASGGEMSRFLLALKTCLAAADPHVTLLFDEIDTGVSGRVSGAMAALLRELAGPAPGVLRDPPTPGGRRRRSPLPGEQGGGGGLHPYASVPPAGHQARQAELAELAGGDHHEARSYAASLLEQHG